MVGKTPRILKNERQRMDVIKSHCGCLPCLLLGHPDRHTTIEHVTQAGRRMTQDSEQHKWTIGMCMWHHFGVCDRGRHKQEMYGDFGPSFAHGRKPFEEYFGDEVDILVPVQDYLLQLFADDPWPEYTISAKAARLTRDKWIHLNANAHSQSSGR